MASKGSRTALWVVGTPIILAAAGMVAMAPPWKPVTLEEVTESIDISEQVRPAAKTPEPDEPPKPPPGKEADDLGGDETASMNAKKAAAKAPRVGAPQPKPAARPVVAVEKKPAIKAPVVAVEPKKTQPAVEPPPKPQPKKIAEPAPKTDRRAPSIGIVEEAKKPAIGIVK